MDCDDAMVALAKREATRSDELRDHLDGCDACSAAAAADWQPFGHLPRDAADGELPTIDPIVYTDTLELTSGGMGRISKATDRRLGREVALKEALDPKLAARFRREALITARLQHPAIVPVYEAGTFPDGHPFYAMRLVWGGTLGTAIDKTKTMAERLALLPHVLALTDALAYAHAHRIVHRDLKPGNVLVGEFGETVVIDWGIAKELDAPDPTSGEWRPSSGQLTRAGAILGTPGFMAPEQASGGTIDERVDVYALGAILYNLLAGVAPFYDADGESSQPTMVIARSIDGPPTPIAELAPEAPADLVAIVERAMARSPKDRYPSAREMAEELRRFAAGKLITREYTLRELARRWIAKHRTPVAVGAIATLALAVVAVIAFVGITRSRAAEREARKSAEEAQRSAERDRDTAREDAAALQESQGLAELAQGDSGRAFAYLAAAFGEKQDASAGLRYLVGAAAQDLALPLETHPAGKAIAFVGDRVATVDDHRIVVRSPDGKVAEKDLGLVYVSAARFDPTGKRVAIQLSRMGAARLEVWDVERLTVQWAVDDPAIAGARIAFDETGRRAAVFAPSRLAVYDLATGQLAASAEVPDIRDVALGTTHLAACGGDGDVRVWDLAALAAPPIRLAARCTLVAFLEPDRLVIANTSYELVRWKIGDAQPDVRMSGHIAINTIAVKKPMIIVGDVTGIVMWRWDGQALGESREVQGGIDKLAFGPDGSTIAGAGPDDRVVVWDTASFHLRQAFGGGHGAIAALAIDATGTRVAALSAEQAQVWAMPRGRLVLRADSTQFTVAGDALVTAFGDALFVRSFEDLAAEPRKLPYPHELQELHGDAGNVTAVGRDHTVAAFDPLRATALDARIVEDASVSAAPGLLLELRGKRARLVPVAGEPRRDLTLSEFPRGGAVDREGRRIAVVYASSVELWDGDTRVRSHALPNGHGDAVLFDPLGERFVVFGGRAAVRVFDVADGRERTLQADGADGAVFSVDGKRLALGLGNTVQLWDLPSGARLFTVSSTISSAYALDAHGALLATGSADGQVRIWDDRGRLLDRLVGSQVGIRRLRFAAGDTRLVAQSKDDHVAVWDVHLDRRSWQEVAEAARTKCAWTLVNGQLVPRR